MFKSQKLKGSSLPGIRVGECMFISEVGIHSTDRTPTTVQNPVHWEVLGRPLLRSSQTNLEMILASTSPKQSPAC